MMFLWKLEHGKLSITIFFHNRCLNHSNIYELGMKKTKDLTHFLLRCKVVKELWKLHPTTKNLDTPQSNVILNLIKEQRREKLSLLPYIIWIGLKGRNQTIFKNETMKPGKCLIEARS
ncbi:hypothetical protein ACH5RR_025567 [Cinchona calisaya]|uniref:Uncharacterized protein n=1 Tax=Cinchona calisaya TaxID=153742 RepID=A0ABD2Z3C7_9GENT